MHMLLPVFAPDVLGSGPVAQPSGNEGYTGLEFNAAWQSTEVCPALRSRSGITNRWTGLTHADWCLSVIGCTTIIMKSMSQDNSAYYLFARFTFAVVSSVTKCLSLLTVTHTLR
jgi:hypothetical protein